MTGRTNITLGENDKERRKTALLLLAEAVGAIGRSGEPSISELMCRLADAAEVQMEETARGLQEILEP